MFCSLPVAIHEKGFYGFVIFSVIHMILSCYLFKRGRPEPWDSNVSIIWVMELDGQIHYVCRKRLHGEYECGV